MDTLTPTIRDIVLSIFDKIGDIKQIREVFELPESQWTSGETAVARTMIFKECFSVTGKCKELEVEAKRILSSGYKPLHYSIYDALIDIAKLKRQGLMEKKQTK